MGLYWNLFLKNVLCREWVLVFSIVGSPIAYSWTQANFVRYRSGDNQCVLFCKHSPVCLVGTFEQLNPKKKVFEQIRVWRIAP